MGACTVCEHEKREALDADLKEGMSLLQAVRKYGIPRSNLSRHRATCIPMAEIRRTHLDKLQERREVKDARIVQATIERLAPVDQTTELLNAYIQAQIAGGKVPSLAMIRTLLSAMELGIKTQLSLESRGEGKEPGQFVIVRGALPGETIPSRPLPYVQDVPQLAQEAPAEKEALQEPESPPQPTQAREKPEKPQDLPAIEFDAQGNILVERRTIPGFAAWAQRNLLEAEENDDDL